MTMAASGSESAGKHRYAAVLLLAVITVVFLIVAPSGALSRATALLLTGSMLLIVVMTSRADLTLRETAAGGVGLLTLVVALAAGLDAIPRPIGSAIGVVVILTTIGQLVRGLVRLLREQGVTLQAVAGALAVYLLLGIFFAFAIGFAARAGHEPYFAQGFDGSESQHVYFSFTSMTTTGYGDLSPATRGGRALSVLEMLVGQIYLVTVISLLVGNLRRRGEQDGNR
jgi:hypothetical protein